MKRLIAVGVVGTWEGDWQPAQGNELAVVAAPIGEGEEVWLEVVYRGGAYWKIPLSAKVPAVFVEEELVHYRIVKDGSRAVVSEATTVEMILANGTTPS